jgi:nucleotide-binding universal stress UspA family protein
MIHILAYTDGKPASSKALAFAARLHRRLAGELAVITVRSHTPATEEPAPVGIDFPLEQKERLPAGLQCLVAAVDLLVEEDILEKPTDIAIRDIAHGHIFVCQTPGGQRIRFYEIFGHFTEALNREIDRHNYDLLVIAPPRAKSFKRLVTGDTTRKLALDLHTSVLVVRGGNADSRYVVCADGSPSARRQFPLLKKMLLAVTRPVDLVWVKPPAADQAQIQDARNCTQQALQWLETCDKNGRLFEREGDNPVDIILEIAGEQAVIVMGASLRHHVYRMVRGSLPMQVLERTPASVLLVKLPPEADVDFFKDPFEC